MQQGIQPTGSYNSSAIDTVNVANGNLVLHIPLLAYKQRGKLPSLSLFLRYNAKGWQRVAVGGTGSGQYKWIATGGGVQVARDNTYLIDTAKTVVGQTSTGGGGAGGGGETPIYAQTYIIHDGSGATHQVGDTETVDGSGLGFSTTTSTIQDRAGVRHTTSQGYGVGSRTPVDQTTNGFTDLQKDPFGNTVTPVLKSSIVTGWTDSVNRSIPAPTEAAIEASGCQTLNYPAASGQTATLTFCGSQHSISSAFGITGIAEYSGTQFMLDSVTLPSGTSWTFSYNSWGELSALTLPTGGQIAYSWASRYTCSTLGYPDRAIATRKITNGANTYTWKYTQLTSPPTGLNSVASVAVTDPLGNDTVHSFVADDHSVCSLHEVEVDAYAGSHTAKTGTCGNAPIAPNLLKSVLTTYTGTGDNVFGLAAQGVGALPYTVTTILDGGTTSQAVYTYDASSTWTDTSIASQSGTSAQTTTFTHGNATKSTLSGYGQCTSGAILKETDVSLNWQAVDAYRIANLLDLPSSSITRDGSGNKAAEQDYSYDESGSPQGAYGDLTTTTEWISHSTSVAQHTTFNTNGMPTQSTDSNGNVTSLSYDSSGLYFNSVVQPTVNGTAEKTQYNYDLNTGLLLKLVDVNGGTTQWVYDTMGRTTKQTYPDTHSDTWSYKDSSKSSSVTNTTPTLVTASIKDGLGNIIQTQVTSDPAGTDYVDLTYDGLGQLLSRSNPYRKTTDVTYGLVQHSYDALGRVTETIEQDGSSFRKWSYTGNGTGSLYQTDVYDDNNNHSQQLRDGLGRLTKVLEPNASNTPSVETDYQYDSLDDLVQVDQWGGPSQSAGDRTRSFSYDELSRLISSNNPETGVVAYSYDKNGNVLTRTDARGVVTTYGYDALNRLTSKKYASDPTSTSAISYFYDKADSGWVFPNQTSPALASIGQTGLVGRLSYETNSNSTIVYGYDAMGRTTLKSVCTPLTCATGDHYDMHFRYDLAGDMIFSDLWFDAVKNAARPNAGYYYGGLSMQYNGASQLITGTADIVDATHPAGIVSGIQYSPLGDLSSIQFGSVAAEGDSYTPRGWLSGRYAMNAQGTTLRSGVYSYDNVGNVSKLVDSASGTTFFTNDRVNRLTSFADYGVGNGATYGYDAWGNLAARTVTGGVGNTFTLTYTSHNQVNPAGSTNSATRYDASGNVYADGVNTYTYDGEGRVYSVNGATEYLYGPDNNRVATGMLSGNVTSEYLYDLNNVLVTTVGTDSKMIRGSLYGGGRHLADYTAGTGAGGGQTEFRLADGVNTYVDKIDQAGNFLETCGSFPFGEGLTCNPSVDYSETHFTDKKRDQESNLDYFGARYYGSTMGRFLSPDPVGGSLLNPQTLNKYAYVINNPLTNTDPTGLYVCATGQDCTAFEKSLDALRGSKNADVSRAAGAYGALGDANGVTVGFADLSKQGEDGKVTSSLGTDANGNLQAQSNVTINTGAKGSAFDAAIGHEGSHVADAQVVVKSIVVDPKTGDFTVGNNITRYQSEQRAYGVTNAILSSEGVKANEGCYGCNLGQGTMQGQVPGIVNRIMGTGNYQSGGKPMGPKNQGGSVVNSVDQTPKAAVPH